MVKPVEGVEGVYRNGRVEPIEPIAEAEGARVIVTWVRPSASVDLREKGIDDPKRLTYAAAWPHLRRTGIGPR
jgi:hypothetical protein